MMVELLERDFLDGLEVEDQETIEALYNGKISKWRRVNSKKRVYLECLDRAIPLDPLTRRYIIKYDSINQEFMFNKA